MAAQNAEGANRNTTDIGVPSSMHIDNTAPDRPELVAAENQPDPRGEAMSAIFANRNKVLEREMNIAAGLASQESASDEGELTPAHREAAAGHNHSAHTPPDEGAVSGAAGAPAPAAPSTAQDAAPQPAPAAGGKRILTVDGQQVEVTDEDLQRLAQQGLSSGKRFQEAARLRQEATQIAQQAQQIYGAHAAVPQAAPQPAARSSINQEQARQMVERLNYGSPEDQQAALMDLATTIESNVQGRTPQGPNPEQILQVAEERVLQRIRFEQNLATINAEFKEVFEDRPLAIAAADRVQGLRTFYAQQGVAKPDLDLYREACSYIKERYVRPSENPAPTPTPAPSSSVQAAPQTSPMQERLERKRAAPQPPAAASKIAADVPQQKAVTPSAIVQQMRKARHQPNY